MARSADPRAVRTREKLIEAYRRLAEAGSPSEISVAALTEAAGVHRSVFYKHFSSPEDLSVHVLRDLFEIIGTADIVMRGEFFIGGLEASRSAMTDLVHFLGKHRTTYAPLLGADAPARAVHLVTEAFAELTARSLLQMTTRPRTVDVEVVAHFLAHGVIGVLGGWLEERHSDLTEDNVVDQLLQCFPGWLTAAVPAPFGEGSPSAPGAPPRVHG